MTSCSLFSRNQKLSLRKKFRLSIKIFSLLRFYFKLSPIFNSLSKCLSNPKFSLNIAKWNTTKTYSLSAKDSLIMPTIQPTQHWKRTENYYFCFPCAASMREWKEKNVSKHGERRIFCWINIQIVETFQRERTLHGRR